MLGVKYVVWLFMVFETLGFTDIFVFYLIWLKFFGFVYDGYVLFLFRLWYVFPLGKWEQKNFTY